MCTEMCEVSKLDKEEEEEVRRKICVHSLIKEVVTSKLIKIGLNLSTFNHYDTFVETTEDL